MRVALDLDNVLVDIVGSARRAAAALAGVLPEEIVDTGLYSTPFGHPDAAVAARIVTDHDFWQREDVLAAALPLVGARDAATRLAQAGALAAYVTRRPGRAAGITRAWLDLHGFPIVDAVHVGHHDAVRNHDACKAEACIGLGATHLVDDSQGEVASAVRLGVAAILVDHPLGRSARREWLEANPGVPLARDAGHAVSMLLDRRPR